MQEVSLSDMMDARELRASIQNHLLNTYKLPLICLTLNIPGPHKVFPGVLNAYELGCKRICQTLEKEALTIVFQTERREKTGYEAFFAVDSNAKNLKQLMVSIEDHTRLGRLFDIDVLDTGGKKLSREESGLPVRTCLLCGQPAHVCSRSRTHSVEELISRIKAMLKEEAFL